MQDAWEHDRIILLASEGNRAYPPCAATPGVRRELLESSAEEGICDTLHIQTGGIRYRHLRELPNRVTCLVTRTVEYNGM